MNRRNQSGYDPTGDVRTGRPPLPEDRARRSLPDEIDPDQPVASGSYVDSQSSAEVGQESASADQSTLGRMASGGTEALRSASDAVTAQVGAATSMAMEKGSELATTASRHVQTYADELAAFTRRRPFGALAGAVIFGIVMGLIGRRRSS